SSKRFDCDAPNAGMGNVARLAHTCKRKLEPASAFEIKVRQHRGSNHKHESKRVAETPFQLWHEIEIHTVNRGNQRRRQEYDCDDRENLDDVVLLDVNHAEGSVQQEDDLV